jgi:hypothetical protein
LLIELVTNVLLYLCKQRMKQMKAPTQKKIKKMFEETLVDMFNNRKKEVYSVVMDAMEDYGISHAIKEGRKNKFVEEKVILEKLNETK